jgi:hypothetical protein
MQQPPMRHRFFNTAWIGFNYTGICKSALKFSYTLLLSSIGALSATTKKEEISQIFAPIPGGGHASSRAVLFMLKSPMWRSTTPHSLQIAAIKM